MGERVIELYWKTLAKSIATDCRAYIFPESIY